MYTVIMKTRGEIDICLKYLPTFGDLENHITGLVTVICINLARLGIKSVLN
jgi:hypothetical protein